MSGYKNFAIVGAGKTGSFIVRQFLKDKVAGTVNEVVVLTRQVSIPSDHFQWMSVRSYWTMKGIQDLCRLRRWRQSDTRRLFQQGIHQVCPGWRGRRRLYHLCDGIELTNRHCRGCEGSRRQTFRAVGIQWSDGEGSRATLCCKGQRSRPTEGSRHSLRPLPHRAVCGLPVGTVRLLLRPPHVRSTLP